MKRFWILDCGFWNEKLDTGCWIKQMRNADPPSVNLRRDRFWNGRNSLWLRVSGGQKDLEVRSQKTGAGRSVLDGTILEYIKCRMLILECGIKKIEDSRFRVVFQGF